MRVSEQQTHTQEGSLLLLWAQVVRVSTKKRNDMSRTRFPLLWTHRDWHLAESHTGEKKT